MLKIGLTGGIGSGKSTTAHYFAALGVPIIDADIIVHNLLKYNQEVFAKIFEHFGTQALKPDNSIDRKYLREIIFNNSTERKWMESLLHPLVFQEIKKLCCITKAPYCIIVMPLLFETGGNKIVDRVLVVNTDIDSQIQRTMKRDNICAAAVSNIIASQSDNIWRLSQANDIIDNNGTEENTQKQVMQLHEFYMKLAKIQT